jgi:3'(2'), 5'-bisphosphate nucleotidase
MLYFSIINRLTNTGLFFLVKKGYYYMDQTLSSAIEAVTAAAKVCGIIQKQLVRDDTLIKQDKSPVTIADFASQAVVCHILKRDFPNIPIVGEEDASDLRSNGNKHLLNKIHSFLPGFTPKEILENIDAGNAEISDIFWTLDPIDGTKGFLRGDQYAVALALVKKGKVTAGALGCPNLPFSENGEAGTLLYASKGNGAFKKSFENENAIKISAASHSDNAPIRFLESVEFGHANYGLQGKVRSHFGTRAASVRYDSQVKYALLAQGKADVYLRLPNDKNPNYQEKIWDHAAGVAIVNEAGGVVSDMNGKELNFGCGKTLKKNRGVIGANRHFHSEIISILKNH